MTGQCGRFTEKLWFSETQSLSRKSRMAKRNGDGLFDDECTCGFALVSLRTALTFHQDFADDGIDVFAIVVTP